MSCCAVGTELLLYTLSRWPIVSPNQHAYNKIEEIELSCRNQETDKRRGRKHYHCSICSTNKFWLFYLESNISWQIDIKRDRPFMTNSSCFFPNKNALICAPSLNVSLCTHINGAVSQEWEDKELRTCHQRAATNQNRYMSFYHFRVTHQLPMAENSELPHGTTSANVSKSPLGDKL